MNLLSAPKGKRRMTLIQSGKLYKFHIRHDSLHTINILQIEDLLKRIDSAKGTKYNNPPYPPVFDANARCDFHVGAQGHSSEDYKVLKSKLQTLLDSKIFLFAPQGLQINNTPSLSHAGPSVHIMEEIIENGSEDDYHTGLS
ncbi:hypothetical protein KIW84_012101 [Lathyrus oleraceus]|uniref:Uncharacterized protein n=1 Tax=Pisum sativum TaxID=3888 RepID=A0A9D5BGS9_PEA|nr:hypothetical protein KIW84_012101 [Pisum sativum]